MNLENQEDVKSDETQVESQVVDKSRRTFARLGAVTPVLLSFASKTVWGQTIDQCTTSGHLSGNTSPGHQYQDNCDDTNPFGVSPGYWLNSNGIGIWPVAQTTLFNDIFDCRKIKIKNNTTGTTFTSNPTLFQAIQVGQNGKINEAGSYTIKPLSGGTDNSLDNDVFHAVAAYLNANMATYAYPFSVTYVKTSFCDKSMGLIKGFQATNIIHGTRDVVKQWLIDNGLYLN